MPVTVSAGVAQFELAVRGPEELIQRADEALYNSKEKGRNRVTAWPDHILRRSRRTSARLTAAPAAVAAAPAAPATPAAPADGQQKAS